MFYRDGKPVTVTWKIDELTQATAKGKSGFLVTGTLSVNTACFASEVGFSQDPEEAAEIALNRAAKLLGLSQQPQSISDPSDVLDIGGTYQRLIHLIDTLSPKLSATSLNSHKTALYHALVRLWCHKTCGAEKPDMSKISDCLDRIQHICQSMETTPSSETIGDCVCTARNLIEAFEREQPCG